MNPRGDQHRGGGRGGRVSTSVARETKIAHTASRERLSLITLSEKERKRLFAYRARAPGGQVDVHVHLCPPTDHPTETIMTCTNCGSPWYDSDGYGGLRCSDCDTPIGGTR